MSTTILAGLCEQIRAAGAARQCLRIRAGGSKDFYGNAPRGEWLDPRGYAGISAYEPSELVVTARCGTLLSALESALAAEQQTLGFEPPRFTAVSTVGGAVAAGLSGPARMATAFRYGGVRESVLGATVIDGRGRVLRFGGTVLKNVAGYDVSRLFAGSMGALGLIAEVSLKVLPAPAVERTLKFELQESAALQLLARCQPQPLPIASSSWHEGCLQLRLLGDEAAVMAAAATLGGESLPAAEGAAWWRSLRDQSHDYFQPGLPLWRLALPRNTAPLGLPGAQLLEWQGTQRWLRTASTAAALRARAAALGGYATLFRRGETDGQAVESTAFTALPAAQLAIHRGLRAQFDPLEVFDFGRLVTEH